jgi:competence protein ComFC
VLLSFAKNLIFPQFCCHCGRWGKLLCHRCHQQLEFLAVSPEVKLESLYLNQVIACCHYSGPTRSLIKEMKYKSVRAVGQTCAQLLYYHADIPHEVDALVPVPLHPSRQLERGFNQAEIMAVELSSLLKRPMLKLLLKSSPTTTQASIHDREKRMSNLKGSFAIAPLAGGRATSASQTPKSALLIDDVLTTGSTLNECAQVLKVAGVETVNAIAFAHRE